MLLCTTVRRALVLAAAASLTLAGGADAQIWKKARETAARAAEREVLNKVDAEVTEAVTCVLGDRECVERAEGEGKAVQVVDEQGQPVPPPEAVAAAFVNFDFVPGDRVLFADDFSGDATGDFPRRLEFRVGNMEVAEWRGGRWLRGTSWPSTFAIPLPETLPERFTLEMEVVPGADNRALQIRFSEGPKHVVEARYFQRRLSGSIRQGAGALAEGRTEEQVEAGTPFMLRVMADGRYVKVYVDGTRVANVPVAEIGRSDRIEIDLAGSTDDAGFVRNIRVAAGGKKLYDALSENGRVATQGIYFDVGSDRIRPESMPTLKEIGEMLREHGDLRLAIEGHTDNAGDAAANQQLSERRAAAVRAYIEQEFQVDGSRLESRGLGASKPTADNGTAEGRQQNRRVELVRL